MSKILIVEDDKKIAMALQIRMKALGYQVISAGDAVFAMSEAIEGKPDVVVLDINLPGGDGLTVAERLQNSPETANIPVVFITASKKVNLRERAAELSAVAFLEKPFSSTDLVDAIELSLSQKSKIEPIASGF